MRPRIGYVLANGSPDVDRGNESGITTRGAQPRRLRHRSCCSYVHPGWLVDSAPGGRSKVLADKKERES